MDNLIVQSDKSSPSSEPAKQLQLLQVGRALASLAVVLCHAELSANAFSDVSRHWFAWGGYGVDFFFVLSGFIIYWAHGHDQRTLDAALTYAGKRLKRIYVPYLPVGLAMVAAYLLFPGLSQGNRDWGFLTSVTLVPDDQPTALSVAWTLRYEMMFYTLFLLFYWSGRLWWLIGLWGLAVVCAAFLSQPAWLGNAWANHLLSQLCLEFIFGMLVARYVGTVPARMWWPALACGLLLCIWYGIWQDAPRAILGLGLAGVVFGLARFELSAKLNVSRYWLYLGAASYSIYLVHNPVQSLAGRFIEHFNFGWSIIFLSCVLIGAISGCVYHTIFEKPAIKFLSSRRFSATPAATRDYSG